MTQVDGVEPIAVVGLAGRLPGARDIAEFWRNQRDGVESVTRFSESELLAAGHDPETVKDPDYVPAAAVIEGADRFDAEFFGYSPRESQILDPQQRVFLECAWEALEDTGHDPARFAGAIGVYAGCFMNKYLPLNLYGNQRFLRSSQAFFARIYNDKDFLATRVSYMCDLRGPAMTVQTACSTSLVAVHLACQALLNYECDMALAGGVAVNVPLKTGYPVVEGGLFSPDGRCRPFDMNARGTVPGYGAGIVVLRRLGDALADRDQIRAVILGTATNNDGSGKVGFTAPSVDAQAEAIATAQSVAGVAPDTIGYLEAHGTGTSLGDPIEVAALTQAFHTPQRGFCAIGSVKANIGHLDAAAGVAGLIRAVLAVQHGEIPPSINVTAPNPVLDLESTPFYLPATARPWPGSGSPRRAGVSSFGIGGTNAHVVLEQAPAGPPGGEAARGWQLLPLSARTPRALAAAATHLADHLERHPDTRLADVAYTLQAGRHRFPVRRHLVCRDVAGASAALRQPDRRRTGTLPSGPGTPQVVFMFPGGGSQYPDMALEVYHSEPAFAEQVDRCADLLRRRLGYDLRRFLFPSAFPGPELDRDDPRAVLASIFTVSYGLARLWQSWGVRPAAMIGHSLGEYPAACLAGVLDLADGLDLAVTRGEIFARAPEGRMLSVQLPEGELRPMLDERLSLAAVNAPRLSLVSGPEPEIDALAARLAAQDVECRKVKINVASHSWMMQPYLEEFAGIVGSYQRRPPQLPFISGVTGTWITPDQATDPAYWARHLREPVRFGDGIRELTSEPGRVLLEVGPGSTLASLAAAQELVPAPVAAPSLPHPQEQRSDLEFLLDTAGRLWQAGVELDWDAFHGRAEPRRVSLPGYPFQRRRHWIAPDSAVGSAEEPEPADPADEPVDDAGPAPGTLWERQLAEIFVDLLGVERVAADDDFFDLGGHSLTAAQLVKRVRRTAGVTMTVREVFAASTVAALAGVVEARMAGRDAVAEVVDLPGEVALDPAISGEGLADPRPGPPRALLLTGATGYLGAFLCADLLRHTDANLYCLVRAGSPAAATERVISRLAACGLPHREPHRIIGVPGDLAEPLLGLDRADFDALADRIDAVYHCGAWVNFARPYRALKTANVTGTGEVLRLATRFRRTPVHHVSTLAVLAGAFVAGVPEVTEREPLPAPVGHDTGYSESKWVAEQVVRLASSRRVPVRIYRPGVILGDSRTGVSNSEDYITKIIQGCVQLGLAPLRDYDLNVATADYVSRAIVDLSMADNVAGDTFHTVDPRPLPWNTMFDHIRAFGYEVRSVAYGQWREFLEQELERRPDNALAPLAGLLADTADRATPRVDCADCARGLDGTGVRLPTIDPDYFATVLRYFVRSGWLPSPTGQGIPTGNGRRAPVPDGTSTR